MTFVSQETSRDEGTPVYLYEFRWGPEPEKCYAYTNAEMQLTWNGINFKPCPITHSEIEVSGELDKATVNITTDAGSELDIRMGGGFSSTIIAIIIYKGHQTGLADYKIEWIGRVLGGTRNDSEIEYSCDPISTSLQRKGARKRMSRQCGKLLYGPACRKDRAEVTSDHFVTDVAGSLVYLPGVWNEHAPVLKYGGGLMWWTTEEGREEIRSIINIDPDDDNAILLSAPATGLEVGMLVHIAPGCNHLGGLEDDCVVIHDNINNYGGCWWIPTENPFGIKNNFW